MRLLACLCLAAAASVPSAAAADPGPPRGEPCGFVSTNGTDSGSPRTFAGVIYGGPLVAPGAEVSITCSIVLNDVRRTAPAVVSETAGPAAHAVVLPPTPMSYVAEDWDLPYLCSAATVDGAAWYWDAATGTWSADPAAPCDPAVTPNAGDPWPCHELVACLVPVLDAAVCPVLVALPSVPGVVDVEEDGDVHVAGEPLWDCPPYDEWT
ncbi:MAG TPA: hypothetical protein VNQ77_03570 [Frankiaceae bacterium]|nr:hypothetical protein [Frankiaceae bacterium]